MSYRTSLNKLLARRGMMIERWTPEVLTANLRLQVDFAFLVRSVIERRNGAFNFVQIGANDGVSRSDDPINFASLSTNFTGVAVEPQPDVFKLLKQNYSAYPGVTLLNRAVHSELTSMTLYRLNPDLLKGLPNLPNWAKTNGIASFDRRHVLFHAHKLRLGAVGVQELTVKCVTVPDLIRRCNKAPDLLQIDVEGYEFEILNAWDLNQVRPQIIHFENLHMSRPNDRTVIDKLSTAGYLFLADRRDTTVYSIAN